MSIGFKAGTANDGYIQVNGVDVINLDTAGNLTFLGSARLLDPTFVGAVQFFPRTTPPNGWLKCNGALVSRTTYAALFASIGTVYGAGDGSTTFAVPDLRGEFLRALDDGRGVDASRVLGSAQAHMIAAHNHTHSRIVGNKQGPTISNVGPGDQWSITGITEPTGDTGGPETRPRNVALLACIRY